MAFEMKDGQGSLFKNERRTTETQPQFRGQVKINGKLLDIAAWTKKTQKGDTFLSLSVSEPRQQAQQPVAAGKQEITDDDLPF